MLQLNLSMTALFISKHPPVFWSPLTCVYVWAFQTLMLFACMNNLFVIPHPQSHLVQDRMTLHTLQPGGRMVGTTVALETQAGGVCRTHWSYVNDMRVALGGERERYNGEWRTLGGGRGGNVQKESRCSYVKWVRWLITVSCKCSPPLFTPTVNECVWVGSRLSVIFKLQSLRLIWTMQFIACVCMIVYKNPVSFSFRTGRREQRATRTPRKESAKMKQDEQMNIRSQTRAAPKRKSHWILLLNFPHLHLTKNST